MSKRRSFYVGAHEEASGGLHGHGLQNTILDTTLPALGVDTASAERQVTQEAYASTIGTALSLVNDRSSIVIARNDTIDPAMLHLDVMGNPPLAEQAVAACQGIPYPPSFLMTLESSAQSRKRRRQKERSIPQVMSPNNVVNSRRTGRRARPDPPCSIPGEAELRHEFTQSLKSEDHDHVQSMCDLYSSIASADSMLQLKDVVSAMRRLDDWIPKREISSVVSTVRALDKLDALQQSTAFLRRVLLLRIAAHRDRLLEELRTGRQTATTTRQSSSAGKLESIVCDMLVQEAYPQSTRHSEEMDIYQWRKKHEVQRKALHNRLSAARNWRQAVELFGYGVVALVPTGGVFQIQNQRHVSAPAFLGHADKPRFETLRGKQCEVLLHFLGRKGDGYVREAAARLTPFVQAVYDGRDYLSKLGVECLGDVKLDTMDPLRVVELCEELPNNGDGSDLSFDKQ